MKNPALIFLSMLMLTGCDTVVAYKQNMPAGLAKPAGYPVPVYTEDMTVPRPCEVIGTASIGGSQFTMFGRSVETEMEKVIQTALKQGADAIRMKSMEEPGFSNASYRLVADLLRYTDVWETIPISEQQFAIYLNTNRLNLDPIEGVWDAGGPVPHRIGIMKDRSKPGRDFVGFVLDTKELSWRRGYKKIDIARGKQRGAYIFNYYLDDFSEGSMMVVLGNAAGFTLTFQKTNGMEMIAYSKDGWFNPD